MRLALFLVAFLVAAPLSAQTETFYVCVGGDGTLPETSTCATAYDAADFNTAGNWDTDDSNDGKIGPNDKVILLDDGGVFRSTFTVQGSGLTAKPITIQGESGGSALINGSDVVTTWTTHYDNLLTNSDWVDWADATVPDGWTKTGTHDGSNFVEESPTDRLHFLSDGTWTGIAFAAGLADTTFNYSVTIDTVTSGAVRLRVGGPAGDVVFSSTGTHTGSQAKGGGDNQVYVVRNAACDVVVGEVKLSLQNYWEAAVTTEPTVVWFDGTFGDKQDTVAELVDEFDWWWGSNLLVVYSTTDPDSAYTAIEATSRTSNIDGNDKSYITVDGLECTKAKNQGIHISSTNAVRATDWIVENSVVSNQDLYGIYVGDSASDILTPNDITIRDNTISLWYRSVQGAASPGTITSPAIFQDEGDGTGGDNLLVSRNTITGDMAIGVSNNDRNGVQVFGGDNIIIDGNEIDQAEHGIYILGDESTGSAETHTIRYNLIHDTSDDFVWISGVGETDSEIHHNLMWATGDNGFQLQTSSVSYGNIYNNVVYSTANAAVHIIFGCVATNFNNNIIMDYGTDESGGGQNAAVFLSTGTTTYGAGSSFDNNIYYKSGDSTPFYETTLTARTLAQWQGDMSDEASSLTSDPLFVDPASDVFTLQSGSPAIDAGEDLGASSKDALLPGSDWPNSVFVVDQDDHGPRWEIGAYVFTHLYRGDVRVVRSKKIGESWQ